jgi:hypothetical protein
MKRNRVALVLMLMFSLHTARALVMYAETGIWPKTWPAELEELRKQCHTTEVATGIQENIYDIYFTNHAQFERAWPAILKVRTPGSPVVLYTVEKPPLGIAGSAPVTRPTVRIYAPTDGYSGGPHSGAATNLQQITRAIEAGQMLHAGAPWPKEISTNGMLPEYVVAKEIDQRLRWIPANPEQDRKSDGAVGFYNRARIDVAIIADGHVIPTDTIVFPPNTPVRKHEK